MAERTYGRNGAWGFRAFPVRAVRLGDRTVPGIFYLVLPFSSVERCSTIVVFGSSAQHDVYAAASGRRLLAPPA